MWIWRCSLEAQLYSAGRTLAVRLWVSQVQRGWGDNVQNGLEAARDPETSDRGFSEI